LRIEQDDAAAIHIAGETLRTTFAQPMVGLVVRDDAGAYCGAFIINNYDGVNADMTGVGRGCWSPRVARDLARYYFGKLGCVRVTARTRASNASAIRACERLGFKREGVLRNGFGDEDALLFGLLASEQRIVRI
jgi:hypothetical protein